MDIFGSIFTFFTDKTKKLSHKTILTLAIIILAVIIDNTLSFTYSYNISNKLEQIEKINSILKENENLDFQQKNDLITLQKNIIEHKTWKEQLYNRIIAIDFKNSDKSAKPTVENDLKNSTHERNYWIHFISSSWIFILSMILLPITVFFGKNDTSMISLLAIIIIIEPFFFGISWIFAKTFSYIPVIMDNPNLNYILNAILHLIIILLFGFIVSKTENKEKLQIT